MTRTEEIKDFAIKRFGNEGNESQFMLSKIQACIVGAKWADEHPKEGLVSIDKACKWIEEYLFEVVGLPDDWVRDSTNMLNGEERFRKAMEE